MTAPGNDAGPQADERSVGDIVGAIMADLSSIVRSEVDLAKTEAKAELTRAGQGAGMFGGAAIGGYFALLFLSLTAMYFLAEIVDQGVAAAIVFAFWTVVTAVLAIVGRSKLKNVDPTLPTTQKTIKEDVQWAKNQK